MQIIKHAAVHQVIEILHRIAQRYLHTMPGNETGDLDDPSSRDKISDTCPVPDSALQATDIRKLFLNIFTSNAVAGGKARSDGRSSCAGFATLYKSGAVKYLSNYFSLALPTTSFPNIFGRTIRLTTFFSLQIKSPVILAGINALQVKFFCYIGSNLPGTGFVLKPRLNAVSVPCKKEGRSASKFTPHMSAVHIIHEAFSKNSLLPGGRLPA